MLWLLVLAVVILILVLMVIQRLGKKMEGLTQPFPCGGDKWPQFLNYLNQNPAKWADLTTFIVNAHPQDSQHLLGNLCTQVASANNKDFPDIDTSLFGMAKRSMVDTSKQQPTKPVATTADSETDSCTKTIISYLNTQSQLCPQVFPGTTSCGNAFYTKYLKQLSDASRNFICDTLIPTGPTQQTDFYLKSFTLNAEQTKEMATNNQVHDMAVWLENYNKGKQTPCDTIDFMAQAKPMLLQKKDGAVLTEDEMTKICTKLQSQKPLTASPEQTFNTQVSTYLTQIDKCDSAAVIKTLNDTSETSKKHKQNIEGFLKNITENSNNLAKQQAAIAALKAELTPLCSQTTTATATATAKPFVTWLKEKKISAPPCGLEVYMDASPIKAQIYDFLGKLNDTKRQAVLNYMCKIATSGQAGGMDQILQQQMLSQPEPNLFTPVWPLPTNKAAPTVTYNDILYRLKPFISTVSSCNNDPYTFGQFLQALPLPADMPEPNDRYSIFASANKNDPATMVNAVCQTIQSSNFKCDRDYGKGCCFGNGCTNYKSLPDLNAEMVNLKFQNPF